MKGNSNNLGIGELKIIKNPEEIVWTVLGSCISVIFHVKSNLSLICHAQSPYPGKHIYKCSDSCPHPCFKDLPESNKYKYVSCSLEYMISYLQKQKVNLQKINTSLVGGASIFSFVNKKDSIGEQNVITAQEILSKYDIKINRKLTGGEYGITIWFHTKDNALKYRRHESYRNIRSYK